MKKAISYLIATAVLAFNAQAATYRVATNQTTDNYLANVLEDISVEVAEKTDGRVRLRNFHNSVLGSQTEYFSNVNRGVIDLGLVSTGVVETIAPEMGIFDLPYLFRSEEEFAKTMLDPEFNAQIVETLSQRGLNLMGIFSGGSRSIYATEPLESFEDLAGRKIRVIGSSTYIEMIKSFGATPTPLPFADTFSGMQQGIVDGAEGGLSGLYDSGFGEVAKYAIKSEQNWLSIFLFASDRFVSRLSEEDLSIVRSVIHKYSQKSFDEFETDSNENLSLAQQKFGVVVTDVDKKPFVDAVAPLHAKAMKDERKAVLLESIFELQHR